MPLDATLPQDISIVNTFAAKLRETRAKCNELENAVISLQTGMPVYVPSTVNNTEYELQPEDIFTKVNAESGELTLYIDPTTLIIGMVYMIKKIDNTANKVIIETTVGTFINRNLTSIELALEGEVIRFVSDGIGAETC